MEVKLGSVRSVNLAAGRFIALDSSPGAKSAAQRIRSRAQWNDKDYNNHSYQQGAVSLYRLL